MLTEEFLQQYETKQPPFTELGAFVYLRTYSRWLEDKQRREHWRETVARVVNYSMSLYQGTASRTALKKEAERLYDAMFNLRMFSSGRTLWTGGTEASLKYPLSNYNCAFVVIDEFSAIGDAFYLLLVGAGVGFRILLEDVSKLPEVNPSIKIVHEEYNGRVKSDRYDDTQTSVQDGVRYIHVGDSKEGWVSALRIYFNTITSNARVRAISINYDSVRPEGEKLKTFGGKASGHVALKNMFDSIHKVIQSGGNKLTSLQVLDILNFIGNGVVVGGVRRTSEIALFDINDSDVMNAKLGLFDAEHANYGQSQRFMSNNSVIFKEKPTREQLLDIFQRIQVNGEPGFFNMEAASERRPNLQGGNPCMEILLDSKGVCNLTELNLMAFVKNGVLDLGSALETIRLATRVGMRMTNVTLELPEWDAIQKRDRLTGVSITGVMDAFDALGWVIPAEEWEKNDKYDFRGTPLRKEAVDVLEALNHAANDEAVKYAKEMRIPVPLLVTAIKPSGTLSQLPTVSSGVHRSFAPTYIRRVRISRTDTLAKVALEVGLPVYPENGQGPLPEEFNVLSPADKMTALEKASTWVIEFPVKTPTKMKASDESALDQFYRYIMMQRFYTDHNTSITITFKPHEVGEIVDALLEHWDEYIAVSFLPSFDNGDTPFPLMPYEAITEVEYNSRADSTVEHAKIIELLTDLEREQALQELLDSDCESGVCSIR